MQAMRRDALLQFLTSKYHVLVDKVRPDFIEDVVQRLEGYCIQDISDLVDRIYFEGIKHQGILSYLY